MPDRSGSQIDHLNLAVPDLAASTAFYEPMLATLDVVRILTIPANGDQSALVGFGWRDRKPFFWLVEGGTVGTGMHLAFTAGSRDEVVAFHAAALAAGATEELAPAVHPEYHADYYGGFVTDVNGISLEAACHHPV